MQIDVYSKKDCGVCQAAKDKLKRMKLPFTEGDIERMTDLHEGWRDDGTVDVMALHCLINQSVPMIVIDGQPFNYSAAMRFLKERTQ